MREISVEDVWSLRKDRPGWSLGEGAPDLKGTNEGGGHKVGAFSHAFKRLQKFCNHCGSYKESQAGKKYCDK